MNAYIDNLIKSDKLRLSVDKSIDFTFTLGSKKVGHDKVLMAGPCSVESREMIFEMAHYLKEMGIDGLRGGAYKPCTFPIRTEKAGWKEGLREEGLKLLKEVHDKTGMPVITEVMSPEKVSMVAEYADVLQVGTRNFQNYPLLDELGKCRRPVLLKRGTWGTLDEILGACERILEGGNNRLAICLRGVVGMPGYRHIFPSIRWAPDLMMIPALKEFTRIPIIYDPSHATGYRKFVLPVAKGAMAMGADGLIIECHFQPEKSISDSDQAVHPDDLKELLPLFTKSV